MDAVPPLQNQLNRLKPLLAALKRALAEDECRLYRSGKLDGLFSSRQGSSGEAASQALLDGLLEIVRTDVRGKEPKQAIEWVRITPQGVDFLHQHESPLATLHELRQLLRTNQANLPAWLLPLQQTLQRVESQLQSEAEFWKQRLAALERRTEEALRRLEAAGPLVPSGVAEVHPWVIDALNYLDRRRHVAQVVSAVKMEEEDRPSEPENEKAYPSDWPRDPRDCPRDCPKDCPLSELFAAVARHHPELTLTAFHDGLRKLHERRVLLLRPGVSTRPADAVYAVISEGRVCHVVGR